MIAGPGLRAVNSPTPSRLTFTAQGSCLESGACLEEGELGRGQPVSVQRTLDS